MSAYTDRLLSMQLAQMKPEERAAYQNQMQGNQRRAGAMRLGAGALDYFGGRRDQQDAEAQIDELGAQAENIQSELGSMRAPGSMDSNTVAEATRNAAILGFQSPAEDPADDLAAQAMALESGADPSKLYSAAAKQDAAQDAQSRAEAKQDFSQGLATAQTDALNRFKQDYQEKAGELDSINQNLSAAQNQSLLAQQRKAKGMQTGLVGASGYLQSGGLDQIKSALGGKEEVPPKEDPEVKVDGDNEVVPPNYDDGNPVIASSARDPELQLNEGQSAASVLDDLDEEFRPQEEIDAARGLKVQQTPGEYDHDTNDMMLMAQGKDGMLIDTGIRQTGGEYVIDPFDAGNMRQSFDKIDPVELEAVKAGKADLRPELLDDLMRMYQAVRFIEEPQFDDGYYEKRMNGHG